MNSVLEKKTGFMENIVILRGGKAFTDLVSQITLNHCPSCIYLGSIKNTRHCRSRLLGPFRSPSLNKKSKKKEENKL